MQLLNQKLQLLLNKQKEAGLGRKLQMPPLGIDFCTNDYLGIIKTNKIATWLNNNLAQPLSHGNGASRLLGGNSTLLTQTENTIATFHQAEAALLFNSGYMANYALISTLATKDDVIFYDSLIHASLHAGIKASKATSYSFEHNNTDALALKLQTIKTLGTVYIITETIFSMDGDFGLVVQLVALANLHNAVLIIDEAHAFGVFGKHGQGLIQQLGLQAQVPIRIYTYGKAAGVHGAAIVGSKVLINYLINFCRPLIYSTAMADTQVAAIFAAYNVMEHCSVERALLFKNVAYYKQKFGQATPTAIQQIIVPSNNAVLAKAQILLAKNIGVLPVRYPTVAKGKERIRVVLHSYNTTADIDTLYNALQENS